MKELKPCPFCGKVPRLSKHFKEDMYQLIHRCTVIGPISIDWHDEKENIINIWNTRNRKEKK